MFKELLDEIFADKGWKYSDVEFILKNKNEGYAAIVFSNSDNSIVFRFRHDWDNGEFNTEDEAAEFIYRKFINIIIRNSINGWTKENNPFTINNPALLLV